MKIYTLTILYNSYTNDIYSIEESVEEEAMHYNMNGTDLGELLDKDEYLLSKLHMEATEVGLA